MELNADKPSVSLRLCYLCLTALFLQKFCPHYSVNGKDELTAFWLMLNSQSNRLCATLKRLIDGENVIHFAFLILHFCDVVLMRFLVLSEIVKHNILLSVFNKKTTLLDDFCPSNHKKTKNDKVV